MSTRHGRLCKILQINLRVTGTIRTIREGSFQINLRVTGTIRTIREGSFQINLRVTGTIRTIREGSFQIRGPQLHNSLPENIRGLTQCTVKLFKHKLDEYLKKHPRQTKNTGIYNTSGHELHHIYAEFPGKLSNTATAESPTWPERLLSNFEVELELEIHDRR